MELGLQEKLFPLLMLVTIRNQKRETQEAYEKGHCSVTVGSPVVYTHACFAKEGLLNRLFSFLSFFSTHGVVKYSVMSLSVIPKCNLDYQLHCIRRLFKKNKLLEGLQMHRKNGAGSTERSSVSPAPVQTQPPPLAASPTRVVCYNC